MDLTAGSFKSTIQSFVFLSSIDNKKFVIFPKKVSERADMKKDKFKYIRNFIQHNKIILLIILFEMNINM